MKLTKERLDELLEYDPELGVFIRKATARGRNGAKGAVVGWADKDGYLRVNIDRKSYAIHRLVFLTMTGEIPTTVDHINRKVDDNRWANLRSATISQNAMNRECQGTPKSGYRNVRWSGGKWTVMLKIKGKLTYGGRFLDVHEAAQVAERMREEAHGDFFIPSLS